MGPLFALLTRPICIAALAGLAIVRRDLAGKRAGQITRKTKGESEFRRRAPTLATSRSFRGACIGSLIGHVSGAREKAVPVVGGEAAFRGETKRLGDGRGASDRLHTHMFGQAPLQ
jgi:hypothetical protein